MSLTTACWILLGLAWGLGALQAKRAEQTEGKRSRAIHLTLTVLAFVLLFTPLFRKGGHQLAGDAITVAGVAFALWARVTLKGNWSASVTIKHEHEFVQRGPYAIVRHPIYTGLLLAMFGTAISYESWIALLSVPIASFAWWRKLELEEQFMTRRFGQPYVDYRNRVRALIPGVL